MDYTNPMQAFQRYVRGIPDDEGDPEEYFDALCPQILGCTEVLPSAIKAILVDEEGLEEDITTYHDAAVSALTEHFIEDDDWPASSVRLLYPVFVKVCEVNSTEPTKQGFAAWIGLMLREDDVAEVMEYWPPA